MVTRLTVEGEGDVDFVSPSKPSLFGTAASSGIVPQSPSSSTALVSMRWAILQCAASLLDVSSAVWLQDYRRPASFRELLAVERSVPEFYSTVVECVFVAQL